MTKQSIQKPRSLRQSLLRTLLVGGITAFVLALVPVIYLAIQASQREQRAVFHGTAQLIGELVQSSVSISDFSDVQRVLGLVSRPHHVVAAVATAEGDLLLKDYTQRDLFIPALDFVRKNKACPALGSSDDIYCDPIRVVGPDPRLNRLLGFVFVAPAVRTSILRPWYLAAGLAIAGLTLLLTALALRTLIHRQIVFPLEAFRSDLDSFTLEKPNMSVMGERVFPVIELQRLHAAFLGLISRLKSEQGLRSQLERRSIRDEVIRDVAHNLGSPIASLAMKIQTIGGMSTEAKAVVNDGLTQIGSIVGKLKTATRLAEATPEQRQKVASTSATKLEMMSGLIDSVVSEKQIEKSNRDDVRLSFEFSSDGYGAFALLNALDFRVVLSNILNNAYEAINGSGEVDVSLTKLGNRIQLKISDNGRGIPDHLQGHVFAEGFSHDKPHGTGRGLFHAKKTISTWGGDVRVESRSGGGTTVVVDLPLVEPPTWFLQKIDLTGVDRVIVLDDDPSVSAAWRLRLKTYDLVSFTDPTSFQEWLAHQRGLDAFDESKLRYLVDLRMGDNCPTGLDVIESAGLADSAILVTSDATQPSVQMRCSFLGAKLLWKMEMGHVPVLGLTAASTLGLKRAEPINGFGNIVQE